MTKWVFPVACSTVGTVVVGEVIRTGNFQLTQFIDRSRDLPGIHSSRAKKRLGIVMERRPSLWGKEWSEGRQIVGFSIRASITLKSRTKKLERETGN